MRPVFALDRILFIPSKTPPHKRRAGDGSGVRAAGDGSFRLRGHSGFEASSIEVDSPRTSYSVFTLAKIRKLHPGAGLFFLVGADAFLEIKTWREWRRVLDQCVFIVMTRPGASLRAARAVLEPEYRDRMASVRTTADVEARIRTGRTILFFRIEALPISSTEIRRRVRGGPVDRRSGSGRRGRPDPLRETLSGTATMTKATKTTKSTPKTAPAAKAKTLTRRQLPPGIRTAIQAALDKKAEDIVVLDLRASASFTEYFRHHDRHECPADGGLSRRDRARS